MERYLEEDGRFYKLTVPEDAEPFSQANREEITEAQYWKRKFTEKELECFKLYADIRTLISDEKDKKWYEKDQVKSRYRLMFSSEDLMFPKEKISITPDHNLRKNWYNPKDADYLKKWAKYNELIYWQFKGRPREVWVKEYGEEEVSRIEKEIHEKVYGVETKKDSHE